MRPYFESHTSGFALRHYESREKGILLINQMNTEIDAANAELKKVAGGVAKS